MSMKKLLAVLAAGLLLVALSSAGVMAQAASPGQAPVVKSQPRGLVVTRKVKVKQKKNIAGYYLQGIPEVYLLANPNPEVLDPLVKSGEIITITARASGDLLTILTINGQKYEGKPAPAAK